MDSHIISPNSFEVLLFQAFNKCEYIKTFNLREAAKRMSKLPILNKRVLWNEWEEEILRYEVVVNHQFQFQHVLEKYRSQFHSSRTAKSLEAHYYRMKRSHNLELADPVRLEQFTSKNTDKIFIINFWIYLKKNSASKPRSKHLQSIEGGNKKI